MTPLNILTTAEKKIFESPPLFTSRERKKYFAFPQGIIKRIQKLTPQNKIYFLVMYGYFKATNKFYTRLFHQNDLDFVAERLDIVSNHTAYNRRTYLNHREIILAYCGYKKFASPTVPFLVTALAPLIRSHTRPKAILYQSCEFLTKQKTEIPSYHTLATLIAKELKQHEKILAEALSSLLTEGHKQMFDSLLTKSPATQRYQLTLLKKFTQSTRPTKIRENITDLLLLKELFATIGSLLQTVELTPEGMKYYAYCVSKFRMLQVQRREETERYLYLTCFIIHQFYMLQDILLDIIILAVQSARNKATAQQQETTFALRKTKAQAIEHVIMNVKTQRELVKEIRSIITLSELNDEQKIKKLEVLLAEKPTQSEPIDSEIAMLQQESSQVIKDADYYNILEKNSVKLQSRVSEIIKHVAFDEKTSNKNILEAIHYYKQHDGNIASSAPIAFLDEKEQEVVFDVQKKLRVSLYKALLFSHIATLIKSGGLNLVHSYKYKAFEAYLLPQDEWEKQKETLLPGDVVDNKKIMDTLTDLLDKRFEQTNKHITDGSNQYIRFKDGRFYLSTPKLEKTEEDEDTVIADLFPKPRSVSLLSVLTTVNDAVPFVDSFTHFQQKHIGIKPEAKAFYAGIIGLGCNIGTAQIAQIARHINEHELENTVNWYFSVENLMSANDAILRFIDRLSMPKLFKKDQNITHTSSDGQKFAIGVDSLNANHSYKYFGSGKGVSVYSFIADTHALFYSTVISSSEREAAYVIDGLLHNDVVKSDIHSTDTHGYSEIIFAITHLLGFTFAPRIKNLQDQRLYSFGKRKTYEAKGYKILPDANIQVDLIKEQWDEILRLIATLKLKETTASQLLKRLSSYSRQHPLYRALKAFGQIIKSIYILTYLDDMELRQAVEKQLNKMESANKFEKAVFYGNNQEFQQETKEEQLIAEGCKRLIANAIILWNYLYISQKYEDATSEEERNTLISRLKQGSIVTWQHINLHGEFDFSDENMKKTFPFDLSKILDLEVG
jgi:TnpA family transposase